MDHVGGIDPSVVVGVAGVLTGRGVSTQEKEFLQFDRVGHIYDGAAVDIGAEYEFAFDDQAVGLWCHDKCKQQSRNT